MKLYRFPGSTACRPIEMFCAEAGIAYESEVVDILSGKHLEPPFVQINPTGLLPAIVDGDLVLTESSAILKYLADKVASPLYPKDLAKRAKVNEIMDWFNTQFYREWGYHFVYAQTLQHLKLASEESNAALVERGRTQTARLLAVLDQSVLGDGRAYLCGNEMTIADCFGAGILSINRWIGQTFDAYPNVARWLERVTARPSWSSVGTDLDNLAGFFAQGTYSRIEGKAKTTG